MLKEETTWIKNILNNEFSKNDFTLLNLGSSTEEFRKTTQPYIYKNVFSPLTEEKKKVIHSDIKNEKGVDLVGDINKESFREQGLLHH